MHTSNLGGKEAMGGLNGANATVKAPCFLNAVAFPELPREHMKYWQSCWSWDLKRTQSQATVQSGFEFGFKSED